MNASGSARLRPLATLASCLTLAGCMSMSGLGGKDEYACNAPAGVACDSVAGTYANAISNNLPSQRKATSVPKAAPPAATGERMAAIATPQPPLDTPLRSAPRILRLWFKPWEDADGDLYDQGYVYVQVDDGQWLIEHAHSTIREAYQPLRAPPATTNDAPASAEVPGAGTPVPYPPITLPPGERE
jgi:conjugal transfer pilus assembly protein TraV